VRRGIEGARFVFSFCAFREFSFKVVECGFYLPDTQAEFECGFYLPDTQAEFECGFISAIKKQS
jgi:hypothetical protein